MVKRYPNFFVVLIGLLCCLSGGAARAELSERDQTLYTSALRFANARQYHDALRLATQAKDDTLKKYIQWKRFMTAGSGAKFEDLVVFLNQNPEWAEIESLQRRAEELMPPSLDDAEVVAWFHQRDPNTLDGQIRYAEALMRLKQDALLIPLVKKAWINGHFTSTRENYFLKRFAKYLSKADHHARLDALLWDHETTAAMRMLNKVDDARKALAQARIALYRQSGGLDAVVARVPKAFQNDAGLLYERMKWRKRRNMTNEVRAILLTPPTDPVRHDLWWNERDYQTRLALNEKKYDLAYQLASHHQQSSGADYAEAEFLSGWIALTFLQKPDVAYQHFNNLFSSVQFPVSLSRGAYWAGRAASTLGKKYEARNWFEKAAEYTTTFYGQLAHAELHRDSRFTFPDRSRITDQDKILFRNSDVVAVINDLVVLGFKQDIDPLMMHLARDASTAGMKELTALLAKKIGRYDLCVRISRLALRQNLPLVLEGYPVVEVPRKGGAEHALVNAIIRQESNFKVNAKSDAGALGLMQIMPATGHRVAKKLKENFSKGRLITDPNYNIRIGHKYLDMLLNQYDGSYVLAIAAYNGGSSRVDQWIRTAGDPRQNVDVLNWIERIPFYETRNYVMRVLENLAIYRARDRKFPLNEDFAQVDLPSPLDDPDSAMAWNSYINRVAWTLKP